MKVLNIVIAKVWGGGEQYVYDTAKALAKQGVEVHIAVDKHCREMQERFGQVAKVLCCDLHSLAGFKSWSFLRSYIEEQQIDIINCHSGHAMAPCLALKLTTRAKLVCFKHNALLAKLDSYHRWQRKHTDAFVCVSQLVYDLQTRGLSVAEKEKFHLVYNGIDTEKYDLFLAKQDSKKDANYFTVGYAGRLAKDKGINFLLEALDMLSRKYPQLRLLLAGSDEKGYKEKLDELVKHKGLQQRVEFLGQVQNMPEFYSRLDVFVLPSVVKEAFGLTICEAMYCGVPVVTTDSGAQREIINSAEVGCVVAAGDAKELAEAIEKLMMDKVYSTQISSCAKIRVEQNFSAHKCAQCIYELYLKL